MKNLKIVFFILFPLFFLCALHSYSQLVSKAPQKKVIDFGWNSPLLDEYKNNLKKYENSPFNGLTIKLPKNAGAGNIFMVHDLKKISADTMGIELRGATTTPESGVLTDNFLALFGASQMDWFSDADWEITDKYLRYAAQLAKAAHCKGIIWDAEPYQPGKNPWKYVEQINIDKLSYKDYYNQVRKRGAQFIKALQEEYPGLVILSLREFSDFQNGSPYSEPMLPVTDIAATEQKLSKAWWGLHLPFTIGILDAINADTRFIDANEEAYFYTSALEFFQVRNIIKDDARALIPVELHQKYAAQYSIGHAISEDYTNGNWAEVISFPYRLKGQAKMLTPRQRALWFEHNAYYALRTSDEYTWLYTEESNWWTGKNVAPGFAAALMRAKKKIANGEPLGFSVEDMLKKARAKAEKLKPEIKKKT
jgi:hypothetical protein